MKLTSVALLATIAVLACPTPGWAAKKKKKETPPAESSGVPAKVETAAEAHDPETQPVSHWYGFVQASGLAAVQGSGGNSFSALVSWNPTYKFTPAWALRGELGASVFKGAGHFFVAEYQVLGAYSGFAPLSLELGGGAQTWFDNGGTSFIASANGAWLLKHRVARYIDRIQAGYTACFFGSDFTHQIRAGIGASF
jgi:hypothetical protein